MGLNEVDYTWSFIIETGDGWRDKGEIFNLKLDAYDKYIVGLRRLLINEYNG
jgi:hypothetical protein